MSSDLAREGNTGGGNSGPQKSIALLEGQQLAFDYDRAMQLTHKIWVDDFDFSTEAFVSEFLGCWMESQMIYDLKSFAGSLVTPVTADFWVWRVTVTMMSQISKFRTSSFLSVIELD